MAKFRVWAKMSSYCYIDVEAEDKYQARDMAEMIDGGDFHSGDDFTDGDWEITDIDPLEENDRVDYYPSDLGMDEEE